MSDSKIAELTTEVAVVKTHLKNQENLLKSSIDSTKELHESVKDQQLTIAKQSANQDRALEMISSALEKQDELFKATREGWEYTAQVDRRLSLAEERIKESDEFWKPIKTYSIRILVGFLMAGVIYASVTAFTKGQL